MSKLNCHGCEGKGWVMVIISECVMPFLRDGQPVPGFGRQTREFATESCPICHGSGAAPTPAES